MSISAYKTWSSGEVLTAADLNASFTQVINNAADLISPFTKNIAAGGFKITGLAAGTAAGESVRFEQLPFGVCHFRMSLTTGLSVTTGDVTAAETLFVVPHSGNAIGLYDGSAGWNIRTSAEMSIDIPDATNTYDVFCYDNGGTPTLELTAWTNETTRATALVRQDGILVKTGATTRRYLGSFYCTTAGNGQTEDSIANRYVWNYYNRVRRPMRALEATDTWAYTTATVRQANASTANQLNFCIGVSEDMARATIYAAASGSAANVQVAVGVGLDVTNAFTSGGFFGVADTVGAGTDWVRLTSSLECYPGVGKHYFSWNEYSQASGTTTWMGDNGSATINQCGIYGEVWG